ncbi:MAG: LysR family transcriptional regulator [Polaromonas sp.]|nr:LysR family transcriptional regulator [Polaromonas sp.]
MRLFTRTTRQIRLTEAGRAYFEQARQALGQLVEAEREATGRQLKPAGQLRISLPTPYGHYRVLPLLPAFRALYPAVEVEVHLSNRNVNFSDEGYDLAIRGRAQPDSNLVARKLEDAELVVVAAPCYLQRAGTPASLEALHQHECIQFLLPRSGQKIAWLFNQDDEPLEVATPGGYCCSEDLLGCVTLARNGAGLLQTYRFIVEEDLHLGKLQEVLQAFKGRSRPFSLIYPNGRHLPLRVRLFIDFLAEKLKSKKQMS